jgi:predicted lipoprotein with Yx(FWY)xxD motif
MKTTHRGLIRRAPIVGLVAAGTALGALTAVPPTLAGAVTRHVTISTQTIGNMGKVLVTNGNALYVLTPSTVACGSTCLKIWPAVTVSAGAKHATAGSGVQKSNLGVTSGPGGIRQVTYKGQPLYRFSGDTKGKVKGNITDEWGKWTAVVVTPAHASGSGSTSVSGSTSGAGSGTSTTSGSGSGGTSAGGGGVSF